MIRLVRKIRIICSKVLNSRDRIELVLKLIMIN
jgi:hypothetical protein